MLEVDRKKFYSLLEDVHALASELVEDKTINVAVLNRLPHQEYFESEKVPADYLSTIAASLNVMISRLPHGEETEIFVRRFNALFRDQKLSINGRYT